MTADELEGFLRGQAAMPARIAGKAARAVDIAKAFSARGGSRSIDLARKVERALIRPGVAPSQRLKSAQGAETFHFNVTTINRSSDFTRHLTGSRTGACAAHQSYLERDGAAERLGAQVAKTKAEMLEETRIALGGRAYIERPAAEEAEGCRLASFGNISETGEDRLAFWRALEAAASRPRSNGIILKRGNDPAFWAKVDSDPAAPEILRSAPPYVPLPHPDPASEANLPKHVAVPRYPDDRSIEVLDYFRMHRSRSRPARDNPAVEFDPGRGGRIQTRLIVELPHELTAEQRLGLAKEYCHKKFVEGREQPLPFWCVIHAPDHHNDRRNVHMHAVFAERPCRRMTHPGTGRECWDFEVVQITKDRFRKTRSRRPFEQNTARDVHSARWVEQARQDFATLANRALGAAGFPKVYDARTYAAMGIAEKPGDRINGKDYAKEKRGESTAAGDRVVAAQWEREERRLAARFATFRPPRTDLDDFDVEIARWRLAPNSVSMHLRVHKHEYRVAYALRGVLEAERAANAFVLAKIQSKILPPLQARNEDASEAQDFVRMFNADIVARHDRAIAMHGFAARRALTALAQAQQAEPERAGDAGFLTGRPRIGVAMLGIVAAGARRGAPAKSYSGLRAAISKRVAERRGLREAMLEEIAARTGDVVSSSGAERDAGEGTTSHGRRTVSHPVAAIPAEAEPVATAVLSEVAEVLDGCRTDRSETGALAPAMPAHGTPSLGVAGLGMPPSGDGLHAEDPRQASEASRSKVPDVAAGRRDPPASGVGHGDNIAVAFMSETGKPIQTRVHPPTPIRTAAEQAAAMAAAAERRRAERIARNDAEMAALRARDRGQIFGGRRSELRPQTATPWIASEKAPDAQPADLQRSFSSTTDVPTPPPAQPTTTSPTPPAGHVSDLDTALRVNPTPDGRSRSIEGPSPDLSAPTEVAASETAETDIPRTSQIPQSAPLGDGSAALERPKEKRVIIDMRAYHRALLAEKSRGRTR